MAQAILDNLEELNWILHLKLKKLRQKQGLNQKEVADLLGKDQVFVSNCETGRRQLDPLELLAFCNIYGISPCELLKSILDRHHEDFTEIFDGCEATTQPKSPDQEPQKEAYNLNTPITDLPLPTRAHNTLPREDIETLGDLLEYEPRELKKIRSMGTGTVDKIENFINGLPSQMMKKHAAEISSDSKSKAGNTAEPLYKTETPLDFLSLDIKERTKTYFKEQNLKTIEEFLLLDKKEMSRTPNVGKKTVKRLLRLQNKLEKALAAAEQGTEKLINFFHDQPEWIREKKIKFLPVFGLKCEESATLQDVLNDRDRDRSLRHIFINSDKPEQLTFRIKKEFEQLQEYGNLLEYWKNRMPEIIEKTFNDLEDREFDILCHRFGLKRDKKKTLKEAGELFGITRERIRQIEEKALRKTNSDLLMGIIAMLDEILIYSGGMASLAQLKEKNSKQYWQDYRTVGFIDLLIETEHLPVYGGGQYIIHSILDGDYVEEFIDYILGYIESQGRPVSFSKFKNHALEKMSDAFKEDLARLDITPEAFLESILEVKKNIGTDPMGKIGLSKWPEVNPETHIEWAIVALHSIDQPAHWKEILRKVEAISGERFKEKTFYNIFSPNDEFLLFDSGNGVYGLDEWKDRFDEKTNQTIAELAYLTVKEKGPLPLDEIHNYILEEKDCSRNSVLIYLEGDPRLTKKEERYHLHPEHKEMGNFKDTRGTWGGINWKKQVRRVEKILAEANQVLPVIEIARRMSLKYEDGPFHTQNLSQLIPEAENIVNIGQGNYGLKSQGHQQLTPLEAIEKTAEKIELDEFSILDIYERVQKIRRVGRISTGKFIKKSNKIVKLENGKYTLKKTLENTEKRKRRERKRPSDGHVFLPLG